jgi:hypothetical protein
MVPIPQIPFIPFIPFIPSNSSGFGDAVIVGRVDVRARGMA